MIEKRIQYLYEMNFIRQLGLVLLLSLTGCGTVNLVTGLSYDTHPSKPAYGANPISEVGIEVQAKRKSDFWFFWRHNSSIIDGWPWNENFDRASDRFGFEYRLKLK